MRTRLVLLSLALAFAAMPGAVFAQHGGVSLALGTVGPGAALEDLDGNAVDLGDYIEGPALIEFWATWCENCEAIQPQMDRIQERWGDELNVVAVAVGVSQTPRRIRRHLESHDPGYTYLFDARGAAVRAYDAAVTSIVVLLDEEGRVAYTGVGRDQDLIGAVERLLGS